jgi:hypothetical protein
LAVDRDLLKKVLAPLGDQRNRRRRQKKEEEESAIQENSETKTYTRYTELPRYIKNPHPIMTDPEFLELTKLVTMRFQKSIVQ